MKRKIEERIEIPKGIACAYSNGILTCRKDSNEISGALKYPGVDIIVKDNSITITADKGNKTYYKLIKTFLSHIKNIFRGLNQKYVYELEICYLHFPISLKVEKNRLIISNFFGEKKSRIAEILPNADVEIKGKRIIVSSLVKEAAGQTAANFEKATKLRRKDRRIFQDGIYIVSKPERISQQERMKDKGVQKNA